MNSSLAANERTRPAPRIPIISGIEGTSIVGTNITTLDTTEHTSRFREDIDLAFEAGIRTLRLCFPWPTIEYEPGKYDWSYLDAVIDYAYARGMRVIADPFHHLSVPPWFTHGYLSKGIRKAYVRYIGKCARRYSFVLEWTVVNEPQATSAMATLLGFWPPYLQSEDAFVRCLIAVARIICEATQEVLRWIPDARFVHTEACERWTAVDDSARGFVAYKNEFRFALLDLVQGLFYSGHLLYPIFRRNGLTPSLLAWFKEHATRIDVLAPDDYTHCHIGWGRDGRSEAFVPVPFGDAAFDYAWRYCVPGSGRTGRIRAMMLGETNLRGTHWDRITWIKFQLEQCEQLAARLESHGIAFEGACLYPLFDSTGWGNFCRHCPVRMHEIDPTGIYPLNGKTLDRERTELSDLVTSYAHGRITSAEMPAYLFERDPRRTWRPEPDGPLVPFDPILEGRLMRKFLPLMRHFPWQETPTTGFRHYADVPELGIQRKAA